MMKLRVSFASVALLAALATGAVQAQGYNESQVLQAYRTAYSQSASQSPANAAMSGLDNCSGPSQEVVQRMRQDAQNAARDHMQIRMPPNPNNVFQNNTCLSAVQSIQIPATLGIVSTFLNSMLRSGSSTACAMANSTWNGMLNNMMTGNTRALVNIGAQAATGNTQALVNYGVNQGTQAMMGAGVNPSVTYSAGQAAQQTYQQQQQQAPAGTSTGLLDRVMNLFR